jgi:hypothetical protein
MRSNALTALTPLGKLLEINIEVLADGIYLHLNELVVFHLYVVHRQPKDEQPARPPF